jgi:hypothetical protein
MTLSSRFRPTVEGLEDRLALSTARFPAPPGGIALTQGQPAAMNQPRLFFVFVGSDWGTDTGKKIEQGLLQATRDLLFSNYLTGETPGGGLTQYGFGGTASLRQDVQDPGRVLVDTAGSLSIAAGSAANQAALQSFLTGKAGVPQPDAANPDWANSTIYVVVGDRTVSGMAGANYGENDRWGKVPGDPLNSRSLAEMLWVGWSEKTSKLSTVDMMMQTLSHELVEGITSGVVANPGPQIVDAGQQNTARLNLGSKPMVEAYWSQFDGRFIIPDVSAAAAQAHHHR